MAEMNEDPALRPDDDFDDDFFSDLDSWDSSLDAIEPELKDDDGENRKPIDTSRFITGLLREAGRGAAGGAAAGVAARVKAVMPAASDAMGTVTSVLSEAETLKNDTISRVRPLLNQTKILGKQLFEQTKSFMPTPVHGYLSEKLEKLLPTEKPEEKYTAPSKDAIRKEESENSLAEIFRLQAEDKEEDRKQAFVDDIIQDQIDQNRHNELYSLIGDIRTQQVFATTFTRSTYTAYLRKDLELKYRHLYLAEDTLEVLRVMANVQEKKLDEIRHNTALPDAQKITLMELAKQKVLGKATEKFLGGFSGAVNSYFGDTIKNIKSQFIDPAIASIGNVNDMMDMAVFGLSSANEMGLTTPSAAAHTLSGKIGQFIGGFAGDRFVKKQLDKLSPEARQMVDDYLSMGKTGAVMLLDEIKNNGLDGVPGLSLGGPVQNILEKVLPDLDRSGGSLTNGLYNNIEEPGKITNKFVATVEEIIPGYLSMQTQYLEQMVELSKVDKKPEDLKKVEGIERKSFNFKEGKFSTQSELEQSMYNEMFGDRESRAARLKGTTNRLRAKINFEDKNTTVKEADFNKAEKELGIWIMNVSMRKKLTKGVLDLEPLQEIAETGKFPDNEYATAFRGIKDPQAVAQLLISLVYRPDGSINHPGLSNLKKIIHDTTLQVVDQNRAGLLKNYKLYGREKMQKFLDVTADGKSFRMNDEVYHSQYDDVTQEELDKNYSEKYDEFGLARKQTTAFDITAKGIGKVAKKFSSGFVKNADKLLSKGAEAIGQKENYDKLKSWVKEKWNKFCELAKKWKLKLLKIPKDILAQALKRVYKHLINSENPNLRELADIAFDKNGMVRKTVDSLRVANLLANVPGFYEILHWIMSKDTPFTYILRQILPKALLILGDMDKDKVDEIRKSKHPEDELVKNVGENRFNGDDSRDTGSSSTDDTADSNNDEDTGDEGPDTDFPDDLGPDLGPGPSPVPKGPGPSPISTGPSGAEQDTKNELDEIRNNLGRKQYKMGAETVGTVNKPTVINDGKDLAGEAGTETIVPLNHSQAAKESFNDAARFHNPDAVLPTKDEEPWVYEDDDDTSTNPNALNRHASGGRAGKKKKKVSKSSLFQRIKDAIKDKTSIDADELDENIRAFAKERYKAGKEKFDQGAEDLKNTANEFKSKAKENAESAFDSMKQYFKSREEADAKKAQEEKDLFADIKNFFKAKQEEEKQKAEANTKRREEKAKQKATDETWDQTEVETDKKKGLSGLFSSKLTKIAESQLDILKRILLQLMTGVAVTKEASRKEIDAALYKELHPKVKHQKSTGDKVWSGIKWTGRRIKNVAYDAPVGVAKWSLRNVYQAGKGTLMNEGFSVYLKPEKGHDVDFEHPLLTREQWREGIFADPDGVKRIKSVRDIKGPVYDIRGKQLISKRDIQIGLVDANGRPIRTLGSRMGRFSHGVWAGGLTAMGKVGSSAADFAKRHQVISSALNFTAEAIKSPFTITKAVMVNWVDVCRKMPDGSIRVLAYAKDLKNGYLQYRNGKKPKSSYSIKEPLWYTNDPVNGENAGQIAITNEDLKAGLCDGKGRPLNRFGNSIGRMMRAGFEFMGNTAKWVVSGPSGLATFAFGILRTGVKEAFRKKNPYIDVFVADEKGKIDQTKPRLLGRKIQEGAYMYRDGKLVKSAYGIEHAVVEIETGNTLIEEDEVKRLVDVRGRKLTRFAGRSLVGKAASLLANAAGHGLKAVTKGMWKLSKGLATGLWKGGKNLFKFATQGIFDTAADIFGYANSVFQETLSTIMRSKTINRDDLKSMVSDKLDVIIDMMKMTRDERKAYRAEEDKEEEATKKENRKKEKAAEAEKKKQARKEKIAAEKAAKAEKAKKVAGDVDGDGLREGSYRAKQKERKEMLGDEWGRYKRRNAAYRRLMARKFRNSLAGRAMKGIGSKIANSALGRIGGGLMGRIGGSIFGKVGGGLLRGGAGILAKAGAGLVAGIGGTGLAILGGVAAAGAIAYGGYKLWQGWKNSGTEANRGSWFFDSDIDVNWRKRRYQEYGLTLDEKTEDALEDFEEDTADLIRESDGSVFSEYDEDDLFEVGEDLGLFTDEDDEDTIKKKKEYLKAWYRLRFAPVLACYMTMLKEYTGDDDIDDIDDIEGEGRQKSASDYFQKLIDRNITNDARKFVPTKEGYEAFLKAKKGGAAAEEKKKQEQEAKTEPNKTEKKESVIANAEIKQAEKKLEDTKQKVEEKKQRKANDDALREKMSADQKKKLEELKSQTDEIQKTAADIKSTKPKTEEKKDTKTTEPAAPNVKADGADSNIGSDSLTQPLKNSATAELGKELKNVWGGGNSSALETAPKLDLSNLEAVQIPDGGTGDLGSYVKRFESGSRGPAAIGYDSTGGTSYGTYQLASKTGTLAKFLEYVKASGGDFGRQLAENMAKVKLNTNSQKGAGPDLWKQFAQVQGGEALHKLEAGFIKKTHYTPALSKISDPEAKALIEKDRGLQEALWSTSVQHGPGNATKGAGGIFNKTFRAGISAEDWLKAIYAKRGTQFGSSSPDVRRSVLDRFKTELPIVLGLSKSSPAATDSTTGDTADATTTDTANSTTGSETSSNVGYDSGPGGGGASTSGAGSPGTLQESPAVTAAKNINLGAVDTSAVKIQNGVDFDNLHPLLKQRITNLGKAYEEQFGKKIIITSGKRSMAQQAALYKKYGPGRAAKPNPYSPHISGVALDANSADMNKADEAGLLEQFGLWRPLKNGLGKTKPEAWHVELMGSRDAKSKRITEETLRAINAAGSDPNAGTEEIKAGDPASQDTSADGDEAKSLQQQDVEAKKQGESAQSSPSSPSPGGGSSSDAASSSSSTSSAPTTSAPTTTSTSEEDEDDELLAIPDSKGPKHPVKFSIDKDGNYVFPDEDLATPSTTTTTPSTPASTPASTPTVPTPPSSIPSAPPAAPVTTTTSATPTTPTDTTSTTSTSSSTTSSPGVSSDAQLQELKLISQLLSTINETLKSSLNKTTTPQNTTTEKATNTQVPQQATPPVNTNNPGLQDLTSAFSNALNAAFSPGAPAYQLLSSLSNSLAPGKTSNNGPQSNTNLNVPVTDGINVSKSHKYRSVPF